MGMNLLRHPVRALVAVGSGVDGNPGGNHACLVVATRKPAILSGMGWDGMGWWVEGATRGGVRRARRGVVGAVRPPTGALECLFAGSCFT